MAVTKQRIRDFFNNSDLNKNYAVGSLPTITNASLARSAAWLGRSKLDLGRDATEDELVVYVWNVISKLVRNYERGVPTEPADFGAER